jgi:hypothetical protein
MDTDRVVIGFFIKSSNVSLLDFQRQIAISMIGGFTLEET